MILIGLGSNLATAAHGGPLENCEAALTALEAEGVEILRRSRWYESAPVPPSGQPWFVNGVAAVAAEGTPSDLLALCQRIERAFGRERRERNAPRTLDLDLLAWDDRVIEDAGAALAIPHPRLQDRAFVLYPLAEIAPDWHHPVLGLSVDSLIRRLAGDQRAFPLENKGDRPPQTVR
ncbi:MAG: 2-amino-4-hydroxy-6-hydroxymethyldihydropteridine diphosphokinase [Alphaproteobacteria bacterium]|nr:2-amino-4-hydroxy-6-hydroxymethyldihydropteridine diphosphokinase [Alphaproteobacteria bacterium]